jgi:NodT family efflux transporter outer membrane factor (OMF) lipoprotein
MAGLDLPDIAPDLPASLLDRRPDIRAAEARIMSANFDVGAARAAFLPSISLTGQGGLESAALAQLLSPAGVASTAASLLAPVFDGGRLKGQLRYDRAHVQELTATYRQTVLGAFRDVEDALSATARLREIERADTDAVTAAEQASKLAQAQFQLGTIDLLTLLDTERSLYSAQDMLLQVRLQRFQAAVALYRALAGGYGDPAPRAVP